MRISIFNISSLSFVVATLLVGCKSDGNYPGSDYMPDMGPAVAYEANVHTSSENYLKHSQRKFSSESTYDKYSGIKKPIEGTIPRGYAGMLEKSASEQVDLENDMINKPMNGYVTYNVTNTEEGRLYASENINNPYSISKAGIAEGKHVYEIFCAVCHGTKLDGNGIIVENGAYPNQPPSFMDDQYKTTKDGKYYHAIMYGKGVMGAYKDKMSDKERWNLIHYIRSQQFGESYSANAIDGGEAINFSESFKAMKSDTTVKSIRLSNVFFETGSSLLLPDSKIQLNKLVAALSANPDVSIEVSGHTDNVGNPVSNLELSQARAESVKNYLVVKGINSSRLKAVGYGQEKPVEPNTTEAGKQANRRTEFSLL